MISRNPTMISPLKRSHWNLPRFHFEAPQREDSQQLQGPRPVMTTRSGHVEGVGVLVRTKSVGFMDFDHVSLYICIYTLWL